MEVGVVDVDGEKGDDHIAKNAASNKSGKQNITENSPEIETINYDDVESPKPNMGMEFDSEDAAKTLYDAYARRVGFSTHVGQFTRAKPDGPIITWEFACSREVFKRKNVESCNAMLRIERKDPDKWIVTKFVEDHNHSMVTPSKVHYLRPRRHFAGATKNVSETLDGTTDVYVTMDGTHVSYEPNRIRNVSPIEPNRPSGNIGPVNYLRTPNERNADTQCIETLTLRFNNLCREAIKYAEEGAIAPETYNAAIAALREGRKKIAAVKKNVAKVTPPSSQGAGNSHEEGNKKAPRSVPEMVPSLWPWQEAMPHRFNLNDGVPASDLNQPSITPVSIHHDSGTDDGTVVLTCFKSMTWVIENKNSTSASKVAVINLKVHVLVNMTLQDYGKNPSGETEVQFRLTRVTLEPMLRSMAYISQQLSTPANKVAVINLKLLEVDLNLQNFELIAYCLCMQLQDTKTTSGETEVKFQVSRDTLGSMLRSMAYIREQL
ncbi:hypothetical protein JRO89_XS14G0002800 [Xanthoceras sorbifolium]|uniref:FAR1 domain-containing protein n=1 Tax=Xanthoceras sorbifolium TaxID=99658 RepID=A0ABQ8H307_9ROSI|nr:hypothetical protein JRO89_XS14G0002800 [Xanthoceras sorbifolium]